MGQTPEEIEKDIEATRDALGEKVDHLAGQVKEGVEVARTQGIKLAGAIFAAVAGVLAIKRIRKR